MWMHIGIHHRSIIVMSRVQCPCLCIHPPIHARVVLLVSATAYARNNTGCGSLVFFCYWVEMVLLQLAGDSHLGSLPSQLAISFVTEKGKLELIKFYIIQLRIKSLTSILPSVCLKPKEKKRKQNKGKEYKNNSSFFLWFERKNGRK